RKALHLHIRVKMGVGLWVFRITGEQHARVDRLQLHLDPDPLQRLLHNGLRLLVTKVGGGLEDDPHATALLDAHAVVPPLPPHLGTTCSNNWAALSRLNSQRVWGD